MNKTAFDTDLKPGGPFSGLVSIWIFLTLLIPIIGTFYPPETYFRDTVITDTNFEKSVIMPYILVSMAFSIAIFYIYLVRRRTVTHDIPIYALTIVCFLSAFYSNLGPGTILRAMRIIPFVGFSVIYSQIYSHKRIVNLFLVAYFVSSIMSIIMGVVFPRFGHSHYVGLYENIWRGAIVEKNAAGLTYALGLLVTISAALLRRPNWVLIWPTGLFCLILIVMTQSVTSIVCLVIILPLLFLIGVVRKTHSEAAILCALTFLAGAVTLALAIWLTPETFAGLFSRDATLTGRADIWAEVWDLVKKRPLTGYGYGFWGFPSVERDGIWSRLGFKPLHSHNSWLDLTLQIGVVGMLLVLYDLVRSMIRGYYLVLHGERNAILPLSVILLLALRSITEVNFSEPNVSGLFWLVWASITLRGLRPGHRPPDGVSRPAVGQSDDLMPFT